MVKDFGCLEHIVKYGRLTGGSAVEHVTVEVNAALTYILIGDLYPVGLRTVYVAVEIVACALEILVDLVVGGVAFPGADIISVGKDRSVCMEKCHLPQDCRDIRLAFLQQAGPLLLRRHDQRTASDNERRHRYEDRIYQ